MFYTFYKQRGNNVLVRYKQDNSNQTKSKILEIQNPTLYKITDEPSDFTSINDEYVKSIEFNSIYEAKDFAKQYKDVDNFGLCGNSNYANQFMIELFEGNAAPYKEEDIRCGYIDIEVDVGEGFPDPTDVTWPINGVTVFDSITSTYFVFGLEYGVTFDINELPDDLKERLKDLKIEYFGYKDEESLLRSLLTHFNIFAYDNSTGWNSDGFDIPYIVNRCNKVLGKAYTKTMLSPFKEIKYKETYDDFGGKRETIDIVGLPHMDYLSVYKKHRNVPRGSYKLDYIAECELGIKKIDYSESKDLQGLYKTNYPKFIVYNIIDVDIIVKLEQKLGLLSLCYAMAYYSISNYSDTLGTVKMWEQLIAKYLYANNKVPPFSRLKYEGDSDFEGAYVKQPVKGFHEWVVSYDLNSLYPHVIQQWNIGPETLVPYSELPESVRNIKDNYTFNDIFDEKIDMSPLKEHNLTMAANFQFYRTDKMSFLSSIMRELYSMRKEYKKKMLAAQRKYVDEKDESLREKYKLEEIFNNSMQYGLKILLNSGYGACGQKNFLYYEIENAEAITMSSQLVNRWTCTKLENFFRGIFNNNDDYWIYSDTDSGYFSIKNFVDEIGFDGDINKIIDKVNELNEQIITPKIESLSLEIKDYLNCYEQRMIWEREVISPKAIWVGKKKYIMRVYDSEGTRYVDKPKYKFTGMESVKSSTPAWARSLLEKCYIIGLEKTQEELHDVLDVIRNDFYFYDINDIAVPSGINGISKYYDEENLFKKGAPKHVKAALNYNHMLDKLGIDKEKISDGNKIKYVELKIPNPTGYEVIAFDTYLPEEFGLYNYINYDLILEKSFIKPLNLFLNVIGWTDERKVDLFSF